MKSKRAIVCIHGLWMKGPVFWFIQRSLRELDAKIYLFSYATIREPIARSSEQLARYLQAIDADQIDFIAHSMGGLLLFELFARVKDERFRRVVLLGTPLRGSAVARALGECSFFKYFLGKSGNTLAKGISEWTAPAETIMIAGSKNIGMGQLFRKALTMPNDGTVAVAETRYPALSAHYLIPETHSSLLFSKQAIKIIKKFLQ